MNVFRNMCNRKLLCVAALAALAWAGLGQSSAADTQPTTSPQSITPIRHQPYWLGERELLGYAPEFQPNIIDFDSQNRPYIRVGHMVQTLDSSGRWLKLDFIRELNARRFNEHYRTGEFQEERVVFDAADIAYMHLDGMGYLRGGNPGLSLLAKSMDHCRSWEVYRLPPGGARLEYWAGHNTMTHPPAILIFHDKTLLLLAPEKDANGKLLSEGPVEVSSDSLMVPNHSGAANSVVTVGDKTHIIWPGATAPNGESGTPQYIATFDRITRKMGPTVFLGMAGKGSPDAHCMPAVCVDSKGYLHVIMGAHGQKMLYMRSREPNSTTSGWSEASSIGTPDKINNISLSYIALVCDPEDTLHLVIRQAYLPESHMGLSYTRKKAGADWENTRELVIPFHSDYSCWYHKLSIDRKGRLFLNYSYFANYLTEPEIDAYRRKWPADGLVVKNVTSWNSNRFNCGSVNPHDPVLLMSEDGGDTWKFAATADFVKGLVEGGK